LNVTASAIATGFLGVLVSQSAISRPIVYAQGTTVMAEHRAGVMNEVQAYYAPTQYLSFGAGHLELEAHDGSHQHEITYARLNLLAKRWNLETAQANIFLWGGVGSARGRYWVTVAGEPSDHDHGEPPPPDVYQQSFSSDAWNGGGQIDYETRRIYASLKTDGNVYGDFWHRIDTVEFGLAPYKHEVDDLSTWLVISGSRYAGNVHEGSELALLLRFFKKRVWLEAGATTDGELRANAMFSF
jgi:hypothetical protein